jgi:PAS domain S-box-containing protein
MIFGLAATALSSAFMIYFVLEPVQSFAINATEDFARICTFFIVGVCISFGIAFQRRIRDVAVGNAERLRTTLESIADAVTVADVNGNITMMNAVAGRLTGWPVSDAIGQPLQAVFQIIHERNRNDVLRVVNPRDVSINVPYGSVLLSRDGSEHSIQASIAPIKDGSRTYGVVLVFRDVTAQRKHQRDMEQTARQLREIATERELLL